MNQPAPASRPVWSNGSWAGWIGLRVILALIALILFILYLASDTPNAHLLVYGDILLAVAVLVP